MILDTASDPTSSGQAFSRFPGELQAAGKGAAVFAELQRPWLWNDQGPSLGRRVASALGEEALCLPRVVGAHRSADGSTKLLLEFADGATVETVHIPREVGQGRVTLCVSSQVGCGMGCTFCATAQMGFQRQLRSEEMVLQILMAMKELGPRHPSELTLVFMGMGEPLQNLPQLARAVAVLCDPAGLGLSPRRITVSTSGLVPKIIEFGALAPRPLLAISLNATTDAVRQALMPVGRRYSLAELAEALRNFPLRPREHITVEYVLLAGVNDADDDARRLADFCAPFPHNINLIPYNEYPQGRFSASRPERIDAFARALLDHRPTLVTVRRSRGSDVQAACGQLAILGKSWAGRDGALNEESGSLSENGSPQRLASE